MDFQTRKNQLITEIKTVAERRAEKALADPDDPRLVKSQTALFDLAEKIEALPDEDPELNGLFKEENELANIMRAAPGEPEKRYHDSTEDLLEAYGIEHETFDNPRQFIEVLRNMVDETIAEYRLRA